MLNNGEPCSSNARFGHFAPPKRARTQPITPRAKERSYWLGGFSRSVLAVAGENAVRRARYLSTYLLLGNTVLLIQHARLAFTLAHRIANRTRKHLQIQRYPKAIFLREKNRREIASQQSARLIYF